MEIVFYLTALIAVATTALALSRANAVHALLYLVLSFLSVAMIFFLLGAPFVAALEVIVYAGAIMVLFVFVVMLLNVGRASQKEREWLKPGVWFGPALIGAVLLFELVYVLGSDGGSVAGVREVDPKSVGIALFGPYVLAVELAAMLLLAGMIGAYHLGRRSQDEAAKRS